MKKPVNSIYSEKRSQRQLKVGEEIRHLLSGILARGELRNPALFDRTLTITEVQISPDLKNASAFYVPLLANSLTDEEKVIISQGLQSCAPFLRSQIAQKLKIRSTPKLRFFYDKTFDNMDEISRLLNNPRVRSDIEKSDIDERDIDERDSEESDHKDNN